MVEHDDESHYEVSLTAGQAFVGVVLILGSLIAAFAFGIVIGMARGEASVHQPDPVTITEETADPVADFAERFEAAGEPSEPEAIESAREPEASDAIREEREDPPAPTTDPRRWSDQPHFAQLLSTTEGEQAEALAARLINGGFETAYVERVAREGAGMLYRVRVRFPNEKGAHDAKPSLAEFAAGEIWIAPSG